MALKVDLTNCDKEPIHIPGKIQDHGFILILNNAFDIICCSRNVSTFLGKQAEEILGKPVDVIDVFTKNAADGKIRYFTELASLQQTTQKPALEVDINGLLMNMIVSSSGDIHILDFEENTSHLKGDLQLLVGMALSKILEDKQLGNLFRNTAGQIRQIIGYDRVMVYKFHEDGHGEVVAEALNEGLDPWLGLHYPASDIPLQARELYRKNLVRLIANVHTEPSPLVSREDVEAPFDLSGSTLRAVSPVHIQYLKNMGVVSSFSVSILDKDRLWGLIACHNYNQRFINYQQRESARLIGQVLSSAISFRQEEEDQHQLAGQRQSVESLTRYLLRNMNVAEALMGQEVNLQDVLESTGAVLCYENTLTTSGRVPDLPFLNELVQWLDAKTTSGHIYSTNRLSDDYPDAVHHKDTASGIIVCRLSKELKEFLIWFRPEVVTTVKWAGNPHKPVEQDEKGLRHISPRNSFAEWREDVEFSSKPWTKYDHDTVLALCGEVNHSISRRATELRIMNERLRQAYAELDAFSYTISHDLKTPLTTIRGYSQIIEQKGKADSQIVVMAQRIQNGAVKMEEMIAEVLQYSKASQTTMVREKIDMKHLLSDIIEDISVGAGVAGLNIQLGTTPDLSGDQLMVFQIFSNLIGNAVKYSSKQVAPHVRVEGERQDGEILYTISDNGVGIDPADHLKIFDLFTRSAGGSNFEGTGVGLAIVKKLVEKHGAKIWLDSEPGTGSRFFVKFPV